MGCSVSDHKKSVCRTKNVALLVLHQLRFSRLQNFKEYEEFSTCRCYLGAALINRLKSMVHWTETDTFFIVAYLHLLSVSIYWFVDFHQLIKGVSKSKRQFFNSSYDSKFWSWFSNPFIYLQCHYFCMWAIKVWWHFPNLNNWTKAIYLISLVGVGIYQLEVDGLEREREAKQRKKHHQSLLNWFSVSSYCHWLLNESS